MFIVDNAVLLLIRKNMPEEKGMELPLPVETLLSPQVALSAVRKITEKQR